MPYPADGFKDWYAIVRVPGLTPHPEKSCYVVPRMETTEESPRQILAARFGFDAFRPGQERGRRGAARRPVRARRLPDRRAARASATSCRRCCSTAITLVVSPLIALMKDQIDFLQRSGIAAARLDSSLDADEQREVSDTAPRRLAQAPLRRAGALQQRALPRPARTRRGSRCSRSTRRTASRSGATTSGPTT